MDVFSTASVPSDTRARYWNEIYSTNLAQVRFNPADHSHFAAELRMGSVGALGLARVHSEPTDIERTRFHIARSRNRVFSFVVQVRGEGLFSHYGHETRLGAGDLTLCDNAVPHRLRFSAPADFILLRASPEILQSYFPCPERICGRRLPQGEGLTDTAVVMAQSLWDQVERGLPRRLGVPLVRNVMELLATSFTGVLGPCHPDTSPQTLKRLEITRFIDAHLREPGLTPHTLARAFSMTSRELQRLFEGGEGAGERILRRRIEEAARLIANPLWRGRTLSSIAFSCGFSSAAHFSRVFHARHGMSPRQYREAHLP